MYVPRDVIPIIQDCVHVSRPNRYPIDEIMIKNVSIWTDRNIKKVRIRIDGITVGILRVEYDTWNEYIAALDELIIADRILDAINWSVYNQYHPTIFLPLLARFYRQERELYMREIHDLSDGFNEYLHMYVQRANLNWIRLCMADGMSAITYL
jgi:hypothetical protein